MQMQCSQFGAFQCRGLNGMASCGPNIYAITCTAPPMACRNCTAASLDTACSRGGGGNTVNYDCMLLIDCNLLFVSLSYFFNNKKSINVGGQCAAGQTFTCQNGQARCMGGNNAAVCTVPDTIACSNTCKPAPCGGSTRTNVNYDWYKYLFKFQDFPTKLLYLQSKPIYFFPKWSMW